MQDPCIETFLLSTSSRFNARALAKYSTVLFNDKFLTEQCVSSLISVHVCSQVPDCRRVVI